MIRPNVSVSLITNLISGCQEVSPQPIGAGLSSPQETALDSPGVLQRLVEHLRPLAFAGGLLLSGCGPARPEVREADDVAEAATPLRAALERHFDPRDLDALASRSFMPASFTSRPERLRILLGDLLRVESLREPIGGSYPVRIRSLRDRRFHMDQVRQEEDTVDQYAYWYVPASAGLSAERIIDVLHHADHYSRFSSGFTHSSLASSPSRGRRIDLEIDAVVTRLRCRIATPDHPTQTRPEGLAYTSWNLDSSQDFLAYDGFWLVLPVRRGGFVVILGSITNTRMPADRAPTAERAANSSMVGFLSDALRSMVDPSRDDAVPIYAVGEIINETGGHTL